MTVDEAIERLTDLKRVYGGYYKLAIMVNEGDHSVTEVVDIKRSYGPSGSSRSLVLIPSEELMLRWQSN